MVNTILLVNPKSAIFFDLDQVLCAPRLSFIKVKGVTMGSDTEFKEVFNWWYFLGILIALLAFPLLHILAWIGRTILL